MEKLYVKIRNPRRTTWYRDYVGEIFEVINTDGEFYILTASLKKEDPSPFKYIDKQDCEVVS